MVGKKNRPCGETHDEAFFSPCMSTKWPLDLIGFGRRDLQTLPLEQEAGFLHFIPFRSLPRSPPLMNSLNWSQNGFF